MPTYTIRRSRAGAPVPTRTHRSGIARTDKRHGLRSDGAARLGGEGYRAMDERRAIKTLLLVETNPLPTV
jgi:hypothetical protein